MNKFYFIPGMADCKNLHQTLAAAQPSKEGISPSNGFTSNSNSYTANDRNRRIQISNIKPVRVKEV